MKPILFATVLTGVFLSGLVACRAEDASSTLQVTGASWGYAGQRKDVKADVVMLCNGKPSCKFVVNVAAFTDPAPGHDKGLMVQWKCGDAVHRDQFPEDKYAELTCP